MEDVRGKRSDLWLNLTAAANVSLGVVRAEPFSQGKQSKAKIRADCKITMIHLESCGESNPELSL